MLVLLTLSTWMGPDGGSCFPSQAEIAAAARVSERTVNRAIKTAERAGWLRTWLVPHAGKRSHSKHYHAAVPSHQHATRDALIPLRGKRRSGGSTRPHGSINTPPEVGSTGHLMSAYISMTSTGPDQPDGLARGEGPSSSLVHNLPARARALAAQGWAPAAIAGVMHKHEVSESLVTEWIGGSDGIRA